MNVVYLYTILLLPKHAATCVNTQDVTKVSPSFPLLPPPPSSSRRVSLLLHNYKRGIIQL